MRAALLTALVVSVLLGAAASVYAAPEAACVALGAKCHCASKLDAPSWIRDSGISGRGDLLRASNEDTSNTKLCGDVVANGHRYEVSSNAAMTSAAGLNGTTAMFDPSSSGDSNVWPLSVGSLAGRVGIRYYMKQSANYDSTNAGSCSNDKYTQLGDYFTAFTTGYTTSNGGGFSPNWCPGPGTCDTRGNWLRVEHYIRSYSLAATTHEVYMKNLTTGQERAFTFPARLSTPEGSPTLSALHSVTNVIHHYRAGGCAGSLTMQYALMATTLATNERIPAASELEGGGPVPTNTSITTVTGAVGATGFVLGRAAGTLLKPGTTTRAQHPGEALAIAAYLILLIAWRLRHAAFR